MTGEAIGRWGPVHAPGGRTEGAPCTSPYGWCDDYDVSAWLQEGKFWHGFATKMRERVVVQWGPDTSLWSLQVRAADLAHTKAGQVLNGDGVGWLDGAKVTAYAQAQRYDKTALELWLAALEQALGASLDPGPLLGYDPANDPANLPPVYKTPDLPDLGGGLMKVAIAGIVVYGIVGLFGGRR